MNFIIITAVVILAVLALAVFAAVFIIQSKQSKGGDERKPYAGPSAAANQLNKPVKTPVNNPTGNPVNNPVAGSVNNQPVNESPGSTEYLFSGQTEVLDENTLLVAIKETSSNGERDISVVIEDEVTVGRLETNGIRVDDPTVSRLQFVFTAEAGAVCIRNSSNSNLTRLNGNPILGTVPIGAGDTIEFGGVRFDIQGIKTA